MVLGFSELLYMKCVEECMAQKCDDEGTRGGRSRGGAASGFQLALEFRHVLPAVGDSTGSQL